MRRGGYNGPPRGNPYAQKGGAAAGSNREGGAPDILKCQVCNKMKTKDQFANRQLLKFSSYNKAFTRNPASVNVTCKVCTPAQTVELTCYICDTTKGLEGFAKNQRKDPDRARCLKCVNKVLETEPDLTPPASSDEEDEEEDTDDDVWEKKPEEDGIGNSSENMVPVQAHPRARPVASPPPPQAPGKTKGSGPTPWSISSAPSSSNSRAGGPARPGNIGGIGPQRYPALPTQNATQYRANAPPQNTTQYRTNTPSQSANSNAGTGDMWETVPVAGPPVAKYGSPWGGRVLAGSTTEAPSHRSNSTSRQAPQDVKKNGWAAISKVHKGKESKWGEGNAAEYNKDEEDEWAKYGRDIRDQKAGKVAKKKKKPVSDSD